MAGMGTQIVGAVEPLFVWNATFPCGEGWLTRLAKGVDQALSSESPYPIEYAARR